MGFILTFLARRLAQGLLIVLVVSFAIFALVRMAPGDPARTILGGMASDELVEQTAREMGLRDPIIVQYGRYLAGILQGDFGTSYIKSEGGGLKLYAGPSIFSVNIPLTDELFLDLRITGAQIEADVVEQGGAIVLKNGRLGGVIE